MEPVFKLVPLTLINLQEEPEERRLGTLISKFKKSQTLKDPPIVTEGIGKGLIQLDGTNRISVLKHLGCSHVVVQVVDYNDTSQVLIKSWVHVSKVNKSEFIKKLTNLKGARTETFKIGLGVTLTGHPLASCSVIFRDGSGLSLYTNSNLENRVKLLRSVVKLYEKLIERDRQVSIESMQQLSDFFGKHKDKNVALFFPSFSSHEIYSLMQKGITLPTGITRHVINGRVLRINYPISMLKREVGNKTKQNFFNRFLSDLNFRFYEESTYIVE